MVNSDELICTAAAGLKTEVRDSLIPRRSAAYEAMRTRQRVLINEDVVAHIGLIDVWIAGGSPALAAVSAAVASETRRWGCS